MVGKKRRTLSKIQETAGDVVPKSFNADLALTSKAKETFLTGKSPCRFNRTRLTTSLVAAVVEPAQRLDLDAVLVEHLTRLRLRPTSFRRKGSGRAYDGVC